MQKDKLNVAVIGCGRWGPNHMRVFANMEGVELAACSDTNPVRLQSAAKHFPGIRTVPDYRVLLKDTGIDAVVIATPTDTHYEMTREALLAGKHVLVEKPMCVDGEQGRKLVQLADRTGLVLMVGHVFLFNDGINRLRESVETGEVGKIQYLDAVRTNLGPIRGDVNALYDLATHDISVFNYLLNDSPVEVSAQGSCITQRSIEDVCFATLRYADGTLGHIHVSWMNPNKVRKLTVVGEKKMALWDDISGDLPLVFYDKRLEEPPRFNSFGEFQYLLRNGDMIVPAIQRGEPLKNQAAAFVRWIVDGRENPSDARFGLQVVEILEAAMQSMANGGAMTAVGRSRESAVAQEVLCG